MSHWKAEQPEAAMKSQDAELTRHLWGFKTKLIRSSPPEISPSNFRVVCIINTCPCQWFSGAIDEAQRREGGGVPHKRATAGS